MSLRAATRQLQRDTGIKAEPDEAIPVGGGGINRAYRVPSDRGPLFAKLNNTVALTMFEAEADGLKALENTASLAVPKAHSLGRVAETAYLFLEWLDLGAKSVAAETALGVGLARQHRVAGERFGWSRDNVIGATPQPNEPANDWVEFLRERRLGFQFALAAENGLPRETQDAGSELLDRLERFFDVEVTVPSLLHGDLWSGNWGASASDVPYIFDPAVYYGDREADLAMSRLFGGFGAAFYDAYADEWPLPPGWEARVDVYNLYHLLNHFNLFGSGYLGQVSGALARLAAR